MSTFKNLDEAKEFAYSQIDLLETIFEKKTTHLMFNKYFSIQGISPIRPLPEVVDGGYMYRYEFDLTIGYNEPVIANAEIGKVVDAHIDVKSDEGDSAIDFIVDINSDRVNVKI